MKSAKDKLQNSDMLGNEGVDRSIVQGDNNMKNRSITSFGLKDKKVMQKEDTDDNMVREEEKDKDKDHKIGNGQAKAEWDDDKNMSGSI